jgi:hypothetical protein
VFRQVTTFPHRVLESVVFRASHRSAPAFLPLVKISCQSDARYLGKSTTLSRSYPVWPRVQILGEEQLRGCAPGRQGLDS